MISELGGLVKVKVSVAIPELDRNLIALHVIADALTQMADAMQRDNDEADDDTPPDGPKVRDVE